MLQRTMRESLYATVGTSALISVIICVTYNRMRIPVIEQDSNPTQNVLDQCRRIVLKSGPPDQFEKKTEDKRPGNNNNNNNDNVESLHSQDGYYGGYDEKDIEEKQKFFASNHEIRKAAFVKKDFKLAKVALQVQTWCPGKIRLGTVADGGKFVCAPWRAPSNCAIYSIGLNNQVTFDRDIMNTLSTHNCSLIGLESNSNIFNPNIYAEIRNGRAFNYALGTANKPAAKLGDVDVFSIQGLMEHLGTKYVDVFKIDIEKGEYSTLLPLLFEGHITPNSTFLCQILIEIHQHLRAFDLIEMLEKSGYLLFSSEPNPWCNECIELSYIHETCREQYGASPKFLDNF